MTRRELARMAGLLSPLENEDNDNPNEVELIAERAKGALLRAIDAETTHEALECMRHLAMATSDALRLVIKMQGDSPHA